ncbi:MAG: hypothetical protein NVS3B26_28530 [Mycobacteriales bacterium]
MLYAFTGPVIEWRGPSPYYYLVVPASVSAEISDLSPAVSYGWGAIPVQARIGTTVFDTSLFPKDGRYLLPLRVAVRRVEHIVAGEERRVEMGLRPPSG